MMRYKDFIYFLEENVQSDNEIDLIIYNIGLVQRIVEQFSNFFNQEDTKQDDSRLIRFEKECNKKIHLALNLGDSETQFIQCHYSQNNITVDCSCVT